jgi:deoxyhypusine synthase
VKMKKEELLATPVEHVDIKSFDARPIIESMKRMSFSARDAARGAHILRTMLEDPDCAIILTLAGSTSAAGCMQIYADLVAHNMIDVIVGTGASIVDMDFFEGLGFRHYLGEPTADDRELRDLYIDRIHDTYIDEEQLQRCDLAVKEIADSLPAGIYSSRRFIREMGRYLADHGRKEGSLVQTALERDVPIFCPAFSDSSAGFGLVLHQVERPDAHVSIDSVRDFRELTEIKIRTGRTGLFMIGGGVPKNFAQDTVVCAEVLGREVEMHRYAVQITVADVRDGACSSSTLKEANSWGKVDSGLEQMIYAEATTVLPLIGSYLYHTGAWKRREPRRLARIFEDG